MKLKQLGLYALFAIMVSCSDNPHVAVNNQNDTSIDPITTSGGDSELAPVVCGTGTPGKGLSCKGTTSDGDSCGQMPIANYHIRLAGQQAWFPQKSSDLIYPQKAETELRFKSDGRLRARIKINPQPEPYSGHDSNGNQMHNCPGRIAGADSAGAHRYQKLSMDINFYTTRLNGSTWVKDQLLQSTHLSGIDVNSCSNIVDLPAEKIKISSNPIVVEVNQVSYDLFCAQTGQYCPSERVMRPQECYDITLQVANDISDDFR